MQITGGKVRFLRRIQAAQFEPKEAEVELTFTMAEGEILTTQLDQVAAQTQAKALEMVGLQPPLAPPSPPAVTKDAYAVKLAAEEALAKAEKAAARERAALANTAKPVDDLTDLAPPVDPDAALLEGVAEISDQELVAAVTRKNQEIKNPKAIHAVRDLFVKLPKGLRDIEQKDRPNFLAKLAALKV